MATINKQLSQEYAIKNEVSIEKLLTSIFVFHESGQCQGHPYLELYADGSGRVVEPRSNREIFSFQSLKDLVRYADDLIIKYKLVWEND